MMAARTIDMYIPVVIFLVCVFYIHSGITEEEIGSPLRVAQCRARCIQRFMSEANFEKGCPQGSDCSMCWENCQLLQSNFPVWWGTICDEKRICFPGCEEACQFHVEIGGSQREPVVQTRGEEVLEVSGGLATWPRPYRAAGPFVYVVMRRVGDRPWRQISQGMTPSARVPDGGILRVLVVNRDGLVAIYSPAPRQSGFGQARAILESLGRGDLLAGYPVPPPPPQGKRINTQIALPTTSIPNNSILEDRRAEVKRSWNLREVSLIHQKYLVIAEIAWEPRRQIGSMRKPFYFVTWEVDGGGLKGNLLTESTTVTLSLCTDTVYHIQVEVAVREGESSPGGERSEELVVDTGRAVVVELEAGTGAGARWATGEGPSRVPAGAGSRELILGVASALALFVLVSLVVLVRTRSTGPTTAKLLPYHQQIHSHAASPPLVHVVNGEERNADGLEITAPTSLQRGSTLHV
ncbi:uncharacterized protein isoform X2 [Rhodnius prolixus]|uniref:uncharacterized protein isoform X2 n=1 Tax=Rhodnius prolixus TaxID=13249 RepID=UPI003D188777